VQVVREHTPDFTQTQDVRDDQGGKQLRIAYLVLAHTNPQLLKRVTEALTTEDCAFFIHIDRESELSNFAGVRGENIFFSEQRRPVSWGEFSQVEATMLLIRQALACSRNHEYLVFLQGSDYPLRSGRYVSEFLERNRGQEFISLLKMPAPGYPLSKINTLRYPANKPARHFASRALAKLRFAKRDYRKHLPGLEPYAGQAWWTLSRGACEYMVEFAESNPHVGEYFRNTFTPDEMYFHTILGNSPLRPRFRRNLMYVDWTNRGNHPSMLNDEHIRMFQAQEKVWVDDEWGPGEVLFARKFSDDRLDLLDRIDEMIKRKEEQGSSSLPSAAWPSSSL
jgi:hypothetical protein